VTSERIVIATRGSALALWQANHVRDRLRAIAPALDVELSIIKTTGDMIVDRPLAEIGGKALFVKEIEQALLAGTADLAVHSMKDVPAELAPGLELVAVSAREIPNDALCVRGGASELSIDTLARGAKVGTSSTRRRCQLLARRPDLQIAMLRGNVPTRIDKLDAGEYDAVMVAAAGLHRLGLAARISQLVPIDISIPAVAQGVLGLEARVGDRRVAELARRAIHDAVEADRVAAERAFLARLGGSCQTPLAAHATLVGDELSIVAMAGLPDGTRVIRSELRGPRGDAAALGARLGDDLLAKGAGEVLAATALP
jgi:hydroxymethylbilane synthase